MHTRFCFNHGFIRNLGPNKFEFLINNEVVHLFTLPNHEKTSVHNMNNWLYDLEGHDESPSPPEKPQIYDHYPAYLSDAISFASATPIAPHHDFTVDINTLQMYVSFLKG